MLSVQAISEVRVVGDPMWSLFILLSKCVLALVMKAGPWGPNWRGSLSAYYSPEHASSLSHFTYMSHSYNLLSICSCQNAHLHLFLLLCMSYLVLLLFPTAYGYEWNLLQTGICQLEIATLQYNLVLCRWIIATCNNHTIADGEIARTSNTIPTQVLSSSHSLCFWYLLNMCLFSWNKHDIAFLLPTSWCIRHTYFRVLAQCLGSTHSFTQTKQTIKYTQIGHGDPIPKSYHQCYKGEGEPVLDFSWTTVNQLFVGMGQTKVSKGVESHHPVILTGQTGHCSSPNESHTTGIIGIFLPVVFQLITIPHNRGNGSHESSPK